MTFEPRFGDRRVKSPSADVLVDVSNAVDAEVTVHGRLRGGLNAGAVRVQVAGRSDAVLKTVPRTSPDDLDRALRTQRMVERMRGRGYPTPAWLAVGASSTQVWHLMEHVDAAPVSELTPSIVAQLMEIVELQAGQAGEPPHHSWYAWRVATGHEPAIVELSAHSRVVSALVQRVRQACVDLPQPRAEPDMVHADFSPGNVLVRDGTVVAVVDIDNAGSGTRATDLTTLTWHTFHDHLDGVRRDLQTTVLGLVGWEWAAGLAATQVLLQLEWPIRLGRHDLLPAVVNRGHRVVDELNALR